MRLILAIATGILALGLVPRPMHGLQISSDASPVETIRMVDAQNGWAVTARCGPCPPHVVPGLLLRTTGGGTQWNDVTPLDSSGKRGDVAYFNVFDSLTAWAVGTAGVFRTTDGGRTWRSMTTPVGGVTSISFINSREGWLLASLGVAMGHEAVVIYRSSNAGRAGPSWQAQHLMTRAAGCRSQVTRVPSPSSMPRQDGLRAIPSQTHCTCMSRRTAGALGDHKDCPYIRN